MRRSLLVVEDEQVIWFSLVRLEEQGFKLLEADSGECAIEFIKTNQTDLLIAISNAWLVPCSKSAQRGRRDTC